MAVDEREHISAVEAISRGSRPSTRCPLDEGWFDPALDRFIDLIADLIVEQKLKEMNVTN